MVSRADLLSELSYPELRERATLRIDVAPTAGNGLRQGSQVVADWPVRSTDMGEVIGQLNGAVMRAITRQVAIVLGDRGQCGVEQANPYSARGKQPMSENEAPAAMLGPANPRLAGH